MENEEIIIKSSDFKNIVDVLKQYRIHLERIPFIDYSKVKLIELDDMFVEDLDFALSNVGTDDKEAFMCEFVIVPFLRKVWKMYKYLDLFSHVLIKTKDFSLIPDYLVAGKNELGYKAVEKPLLVTVEAKFEKFNEGWFQATMQMLAAQQINNTTEIPIYAIVTTGDVWQVGKLENNILYKHPASLSVENPKKLAGVLAYIFGECEKIAEKMF